MATDYIVPEHHKENLEHQPIPEASAEGQPLEVQSNAETQNSLGTNEAVPVKEAMPNPVLPGLSGEPMTKKEKADLGLDGLLGNNSGQVSQQTILEGLLNEKEIDPHDATDANAIQDSLLH